ncbi:MAG: hypothetical protein AABW88_01205 [Nanoarchaeota archaeon]
MSLKDSLLELGSTYEEIKNAARVAINQVKSKAKDITDVQRIQYLIETKEFNLKTNLLAVFDLAERHEVKVDTLKKLHRKYSDIEAGVSRDKKKLEELGLKNIVFGPKALGAFAANGSTIYLYINSLNKTVNVKIYPEDEEKGWGQPFEKYAYALKKDIEKTIQE